MTDVLNEKGEVLGHADDPGLPGTPGVAGIPDKQEDPFADENFFDNLEIDEDRILEMQKGGGEILEPSNKCESGACEI
ncbi:hypothetical protein HOU08_gp019 [Dickeya phage vB_DsoM_JA29]|uniref:Uncharacterized protein n=1 Tax=Dickeya phage vB_DsoM_JA29 TaxID=2283031 RepID=A0A384ZX02_9CAUD|nr:hypothetical protein HOU08_gp019 [Dickeya phage vB_DsoM_JA29]AXG66745.1 hypothetical protein JA29_019 [Dickeya phage vB_DsoM_JA29]